MRRSLDGLSTIARPDLRPLTGPALQQGGLDYLNAVRPGEIERRRQLQAAAGDPHADWNAADETIMGSPERSPAWGGFFGALRANSGDGPIEMSDSQAGAPLLQPSTIDLADVPAASGAGRFRTPTLALRALRGLGGR